MRLKKTDKMALAKRIVAVAMDRLRDHGETVKIQGTAGLTRQFESGSIMIMNATLFTRAPGMSSQNLLDIWSGPKVFSVRWEPFEIVRFNYGEWQNAFVPGSFDFSKRATSMPVKSRSIQRVGERVYIVGLPAGGLPEGPLMWAKDPINGDLRLVSKDNENALD